MVLTGRDGEGYMRSLTLSSSTSFVCLLYQSPPSSGGVEAEDKEAVAYLVGGLGDNGLVVLTPGVSVITVAALEKSVPQSAPTTHPNSVSQFKQKKLLASQIILYARCLIG